MLALDFLIFIVSCLVLAKSGTMIVEALINLSRLLRIKEFILAFVLVAFSTSLPDLSVGITSALQGHPEIYLGALIGANILDISLVVGISVVLAKGIQLKKRGEILKNSLWLLPVAALPVILFIIGGQLSRIDGVILLAVFCVYVYNLYREGRHLDDAVIRKDDLKTLKEEEREERKEEKKDKKKDKKEERKLNHLANKNFIEKTKSIFFFMKDWLFLGVAVTLLVLSANYAVKYAQAISLDLGFPELLIGMFVLSFGTTLPELTFEITAVLKNRRGLLLADPMGSIIINSTLVIGIVSLIHPIKAPFALFLVGAVFMLALIFVFTLFVATEEKLSIKEGIALILLYLIFLFIEISLKSAQFGG